MNTVKRFVCYYAGINLVLAALLLALSSMAPDDLGAASESSLQTSAPSQSQAPSLASAEMPRT